MKKLIIAATFLVASAAFAADHSHAAKPHALLDKLRPLVGTWETTVEGQKMHTVYSLPAGGTALMENLMPEGMSMVNMIHPDGDALLMTHYCIGGTQPRYRATKFEGDKLVFELVDGTNLGDSFMAGVTFTMKDKDHLVQEWINRKGGKDEIWKFEFTRLK